jgi:small GTP-binding protein
MNYDHLYKIVIFGETSVGKTSILKRYTQDLYNEYIPLTIGIEFGTKYVELRNKEIAKIHIWDIAANPVIATLFKTYIKIIDGGVIIFDISNKHSFDCLTYWMNYIEKNYKHDNIQFILIGNKCDMKNRIEVNDYDIQNFINKYPNIIYNYFESSAKNNINIDDPFVDIVNIIYENNIEKLNKNINMKIYENISPSIKTQCSIM